MSLDSVALEWSSPAAESALTSQNFTLTRGESVDLVFARKTGSSRVITGATITVRFATSDTTHTTKKKTAVVSGTGFTATLTDTDTTEMGPQSWYFQAFDETNKELLSFGWMALLENSDLSESGGVLPFVDTYVPLTRTLTINGTAYDLSADRSWTISAGSSEWGDITGTLSDQTDLQSALDAKQNADAQLTSLAGLAYAGNAGYVVRVNAGETGFELAAGGGGGVPTAITVANEAADTTGFLLGVTAATGDLGPKTNAALTINFATATIGATTFVGALTGNVTGNASGSAGSVAVGGITGAGTGVLTALAINVGSAGAVVVLNGAAGTPSSLTLTNATGLPVSGITPSTSTAIGVGSIELGHASDTTLTRVSAGVVAIEGVNILTTATGQPLDTQLTALAGLSYAGNAGKAIVVTGAETGFELVTVGGGTASAVTVANEASDTSCFVLFTTAATGDLGPKSNAGLGFNSSTGVLSATGFSGPINGTVGATTPAAGTFTALTVSGRTQVAAMDFGTIADDGDSGVAKTIDFSAKNIRKVRLTGSCTFTLTPPAGCAGVILVVTANSTGGYTSTLPGNWIWTGGAPDNLPADETQVWSALWDGTNYRADYTSSSATTLKVSVADAAADTTTWLMLARAQTGDQAAATDASVWYNANTTVGGHADSRLLNLGSSGHVGAIGLWDDDSGNYSKIWGGDGGVYFSGNISAGDGIATVGSLACAAEIELGHASDTTLTRVSAGVVAIEGVNILTAATGQPLDATLTALAALTIAANSLTIGTGADAFAQTTFAANTFPARASTGDLVAKTITDAALTVLDDTTVAAMVDTLGGSTSTGSGGLMRSTSGRVTTEISPVSNDGAALGTTSLGWADFHIANGGTINWFNGTLTLTQAGERLTLYGLNTPEFVIGGAGINGYLWLGDLTGSSIIGMYALGGIFHFSVGLESEGRISAPNVIPGYTTTATAAGTTTLTVASNYQQFFTGSTTQNCKMPVTSTLVLGQSWLVVNNSTGVVTIQSSGSNTILALVAGARAVVTCISTSGTTAASWSASALPAAALTGVVAPANGGTGVANNAASTITISGSYALTITLTNTTSVTFPTSGTLATIEEATSTASSATPTPTGGSARNLYTLTALATNAVFAAPSGSPAHGNRLLIIIVPDATPRTLSFDGIYRWIGQTAPTTTVASKIMMLAGVYNGGSSQWLMSGLAQET